MAIPSTAQATIVKESESTISIDLTEERYLFFLNQRQDVLQKDVIFYFKNDTRLHMSYIESKRQIERKNIFAFSDGLFFPIVRTVSEEQIVQPTQLKDRPANAPAATTATSSITNLDYGICEYFIRKAIHRHFYFHDDEIRVSYEQEDTEQGIRWCVKFELEYDNDLDYRKILHTEQKIMNSVIRELGRDFYASLELFKPLDLETIFNCIMCKVQPWHCMSIGVPYKWAYKWNGVKAKAMIIGVDINDGIACGTIYVWPDASDVKIKKIVGENVALMQKLVNLCLIFEELNNFVVLIDIVGSNYNECNFATEPSTTVEILDYINLCYNEGDPFYIVDDDDCVNKKRLFVQKFYDEPRAENYDIRYHDGFIIVQDDLLLKWKYPTVDVMCEDSNNYVVGDNNVFQLPFVGEKKCIYELSGDWKVIRKRNDRVIHSSEKEFQQFLKSIEYININGEGSHE